MSDYITKKQRKEWRKSICEKRGHTLTLMSSTTRTKPYYLCGTCFATLEYLTEEASE